MVTLKRILYFFNVDTIILYKRGNNTGKEVTLVLKKVVHLFFIITGGTLGYLYVPEIIKALHVTDVKWLTSPYVGLVIGVIILFLITYWIVDYIMDALRWVE